MSMGKGLWPALDHIQPKSGASPAPGTGPADEMRHTRP